MAVDEVLVRGRPGVRLPLHARMTVVVGEDHRERPVLRRALVAALAGRQPGAEVRLRDGLGRRVLVRGWANAPAIDVLDDDGALVTPASEAPSAAADEGTASDAHDPTAAETAPARESGELPPPDERVLPVVRVIGPDDLAAPGDGPQDTPSARHARAASLHRLLGLAARAREGADLMRCPPVLVLDETFAQLDAATTWDLLELLERLAFQTGVQVLYLTADPVVLGWARPRADAGRLALTTGASIGGGPDAA